MGRIVSRIAYVIRRFELYLFLVCRVAVMNWRVRPETPALSERSKWLELIALCA
jgi:hypothetical protein